MKLNAYQAVQQLQEQANWAYTNNKLTEQRHKARIELLQIIADKLNDQDATIRKQSQLAKQIHVLKEANIELKKIIEAIQIIYTCTDSAFELPPLSILQLDVVKEFYWSRAAHATPADYETYFFEKNFIEQSLKAQLSTEQKNTFNQSLNYFKLI